MVKEVNCSLVLSPALLEKPRHLWYAACSWQVEGGKACPWQTCGTKICRQLCGILASELGQARRGLGTSASLSLQ